MAMKEDEVDPEIIKKVAKYMTAADQNFKKVERYFTPDFAKYYLFIRIILKPDSSYQKVINYHQAHIK